MPRLRLPASFYEPPFVGGARSDLLLVHQEDGEVDALDPVLMRRLFSGERPLPGATPGQRSARLVLVELHLGEHKGFPQSRDDLEAIAVTSSLFVRAPLLPNALLDRARMERAPARATTAGDATLEWEPTPDEEDRVLGAAAQLLAELAEYFFVRSGCRADGCIALDA